MSMPTDDYELARHTFLRNDGFIAQDQLDYSGV